MRALLFTLALAACATPKQAELGAPVAREPSPLAAAPGHPPLPAVAPLTVVSLPAGASPIVTLRLVFRAGSVDDPPGKEGLTALTTRVLFEGGTVTRTAAQFRRALYPMAAELETDTDKEFTTIAARVHRERLDAFLPLLLEALLEPRLDVKELERLRAEQLTQLRNRLRNENDEELARVMLDALLFEDHPYRHAIIGTEAGLSAITIDDVRAQWQRLFTRDRLVVGTAGAATPSDAARLAERLRSLPAAGAPRVVAPFPPARPREALVIRRHTPSTAGSFGFAWPVRRDHPDFPALFLGISFLGEHRQEHGMLFRELRDRRGLNYGTYAYAEHYRQDGWEPVPRPGIRRTVEDFSIWLRPVEAANGPFATRAVMHVLAETLTRPLPPERFETARGFLLGALDQWTLTDQRRLGWAIDEVLTGTPGHVERLRAAIATLTPDAVQRALVTHLDPGRLSFVFVTRDAEHLAEQLTGPAPTPAVYPTPRPADVLEADARIERTPVPLDRARIRIVDAAEVLAK